MTSYIANNKTAAKNYKTLLVVPAITMLSAFGAVSVTKGVNPLNLSNIVTEVSAQDATIAFPLHNTTGYGCNIKEWHFIVNQIKETMPMPEYIDITWSDGSTLRIYRDTSNPAPTAAHFRIDLTTLGGSRYADLLPTGGTVMMVASWNGQFNTSHGPCGAVTPTPTTVPTSTPTAVPTSTPTVMPTGVTATPTTVPTATPTTVVTNPTSTPVPTITKEAAFDVVDPQVLGATTEMPDTSAKVESKSNTVVYSVLGLAVSAVLVTAQRLKNRNLK